MRCLVALLAACLALAALADARSLIDQSALGRRSLQQSLDRASTCALIRSDPDLSSMADAIRPGCALLRSPEAQAMIPQLASSMGFSTADVNVVLSCICDGGRRRALAGASTQLTPALVGQLVAQHPELQSMVDTIRPFCGLLSSVDVAGMLAGQGFSPTDVQAVLAYICG
ncbi:hypothetical protein C2E21_5291 [Chlorella sorokiniana]|uniref:Uncharacterized protein n=1 Tax=Chlorella sorokiniana TaxID=3076 RepID=A0A2P6TPY3_CHLSO|nr:hypothetical protein C2E21_5291 [Chlorella sorokiniana]|eukprot:PRW56096.1 hypothetical protein C2E21_5291 [Chlorella sorokiniana]